jgi:hypothetical protein
MIMLKTNKVKVMENVYKEFGVFTAEYQFVVKINKKVENILTSGLSKVNSLFQ